MKIPIKENSITLEQIKQALDTKFGNAYQINYKNKYVIAVAKSNLIGALVIVTKNKIIVNGGFPKSITQMIFTALIIVFALLIPLVIYYFVFHKKMKEIENEVASFLKELYTDVILE